MKCCERLEDDVQYNPNNRSTVTTYDCTDTNGFIVHDCFCFVFSANFHFEIELRVNGTPLGLIRSLLCFTVIKRVCFNREQLSNYVPAIWWLYFARCLRFKKTLPNAKLDKLALLLSPQCGLGTADQLWIISTVLTFRKKREQRSTESFNSV